MQATVGPPVYHMVHQLVDEHMPMDESSLFSQALNSAVDGFVSFEDCRERVARRGFKPCKEGEMEKRACLLLSLSLSPLSLIGRTMPHLHALRHVFDVNTAMGMANRVTVVGNEIALNWESQPFMTAPESHMSAQAISCLFDVTRNYIMGDMTVPSGVPTHEPLGFQTMLSLGSNLNREHTPEFALIEVLSERPDIQADAAAKALGCSGRTLQRRLHARGLSLPRLRQAGNMLRGVGLLCRGGSLSHIAAEAGFSDYSHFARTLHRASGFSPTSLRRSLALLDISRLQSVT